MGQVLDFRPRCINYGCVRFVAHSGARLRPVCGHCHKAGYGAQAYSFGVMPFRTGRCSNDAGQLGFPCPINYEQAPWAFGVTEIDHIDGNHVNNVLSNVMELCPMCHKKKGMLNGDYSGFRYAKA
jgi:hypothetical protein